MTEDLSAIHRPITNLFPRSTAEDGLRRFRLSGDQIQFYLKNGYLAGIPMLDDRQVDFLLDELSRLQDPAHPGRSLFYEFHTNESPSSERVLFHALGAWRIEPGFHDLLWNPAFTVAASQLLDGSIRFWHDQLFCKPAGQGSVVAWHQDYSYWTRTQPMAHLSCFIALDDSYAENGCLRYVPGSHNWDLLPITGLAGDMRAIESVLTKQQLEMFKPIPIELKRGQASFHHPLMVHGSFENNSERDRRAAVINAFRDGVRSASDAPLLESVPPIAAGQKIEGQFFPLLSGPVAL
ncbi:MAG TPA: phytanoyl-CoA dioxygenase family protein [Blastocatellia bacterium]|nr:phytanoyl-CoA dioxygenase family protein [Blastocatellia bacterium]